MERTFVIFKPDAIKKEIVDDIILQIYQNDLKIDKIKEIDIDKTVLAQHYNHIVDKPFYKDIERYMTECPVYIAILSGNNAISKWRELMGSTNPLDAKPDTIRGRFGEVGDGNIYNVVHGSDSAESAEKEIKLWFGKESNE